MKTINKYINERLVLSKTRANNDYGYIDEMPNGKDKSEEVFNVIADRYGDMFDDAKLLKSGNTKLGRISSNYLVSGGLYNNSEFTLYIYKNEYIIRRTNYDSYSPMPAKFIQGLKTLSETLDKLSDKYLFDNHMAIGNFGGFPSITIPNGFVSELPVGVCITGNCYDDENVLNIAYALESAMPYKNQIAGGVNND